VRMVVVAIPIVQMPFACLLSSHVYIAHCVCPYMSIGFSHSLVVLGRRVCQQNERKTKMQRRHWRTIIHPLYLRGLYVGLRVMK
jgi:hypothetical protein